MAVNNMTETTDSVGTRDLVVTRVFDAPVEQVWKAWTDGDQVKRWWGPTGFTSPLAEMDVREGGTSLVCMRSPDGHDLHNTWTYSEVAPTRRLVFVLHFADKDGNKVEPASLGLPSEIPSAVRHVVSFKTRGDSQTEMTVTEYGYTSDQIFDISKVGLEQCLDKMEASLTTA
jgi:uncharacterized protein YndB with AHSA1/START domain